jgi:ribosomal protein L7/L12
MFTNAAHLEKVCENKLQSGATLDDVIVYLHTQGVSILDAIKVIRNAGHMPLGEAKRMVSSHTLWRSIVEANKTLHDEIEAAAREL